MRLYEIQSGVTERWCLTAWDEKLLVSQFDILEEHSQKINVN